MDSSLLSFVVTELKRRRGAWPAVASGSGVSYSTIAKIVQGVISDPGVRKVEALAAYLRDNPVVAAADEAKTV